MNEKLNCAYTKFSFDNNDIKSILGIPLVLEFD